jgi:hypothetical protein
LIDLLGASCGRLAPARPSHGREDERNPLGAGRAAQEGRMRKRLIDALEEVILAERLAAELRQTHGLGAEQYCDGLIQTRAKNDPERMRLQDVRRALRWI